MSYDYETYIANPLVAENTFRTAVPEACAVPTFAHARALLPDPCWEGHETAIACYWKAWELAFANLRQPVAGSGFISNFIDSAFWNQCLFMWDSAFILLFGRYGNRAFNFQRTLDNFYAKQHPDGFICRQLRESDGADCFERFDPTSTGPNILPWTEWEYYQAFGDQERLARVFPVLVAYYQWLRYYRTWPDGSYWSSGWACGMDNQPRQPAGDHADFGHGHLSWIDACLQQIYAATLLGRMAEVLGRTADIAALRADAATLSDLVNRTMWDEETAFYTDRLRGGAPSHVKSIGAYWALLAGVVPEARRAAFLAHLENPAEFNRPHRVPTLAADDPHYDPAGGYWRGGVWAPTTYMVLSGLRAQGEEALAAAIAANHHAHVVRVFEETGTLWENYAPEQVAPGTPAIRDFVGWTGLSPIAIFFEYILGIRCDMPARRVIWRIRQLDAHGIARYPLGRLGVLDLACDARSAPTDRPRVQATASVPLTLEIIWEGGHEEMTV
jgi:glycogen debranching enzyme